MKALLPALAMLALASCASTRTSLDQYREAEPLARDGRYAEAAAVIEGAKEKSYKEKDRVLYWLDLGMLCHWAGQYDQSNQYLTEAENAIEELFTKSVSKAMASGVLNDNALDYSGEDYEDIYVNIFKALNYIALENREDAMVEIRRVAIKLNILDDKYGSLIDEYNGSSDAEGELERQENRFHNDILARYLSLLLYRAEGSFDDAAIDLREIEEAWKSQSQIYDFDRPAMPSVEDGDGKALVNVLAFTGLGPVKLADTFYVHTGPDIVYLASTKQEEDYATEVAGFTFLIVPGVRPGIHFKIQFPRIEARGSDVDRIVLRLDGNAAGELQLLERTEDIAVETFRLKQPLTVGKTIIRATLKNIAKEAGKDAASDALTDQMGLGGAILGFFAGIAADVAVDATENADLRISHFFPAEARVAEFAVDPGTYRVTVEYWDGSNLLGVRDHGEMTFAPGGLNLVESCLLR